MGCEVNMHLGRSQSDGNSKTIIASGGGTRSAAKQNVDGSV
jgi:hypothetical protein